MRRLALALFVALAAVAIVPAGASAQALYVLSQKDTGGAGLTGLVQLSDGGGELLRNGVGGAAIAGSGVGPYVYNSGGTGSIKQFSGGTYRTIRSGVGGGIRSMTVTGRGLVVANVNKLQFASSSGLSDVPHGTISDGPWVSITTLPNGHILGWAWNQGWGSLYDFNLAGGAPSKQDFTGQTNDPLFNNRNNGGTCGGGPVPNSGGISADGQGGVWLASAGCEGPNGGLIYYAAPGGSFNVLPGTTAFNHPHITSTGTGTAYISETFETGPAEGHIYKATPSGIQSEVTKPGAGAKLQNSALYGLAIDRCYTTCAVSPPSIINPVATTQKLTVPKAKSVKLGKKGFKLKLKCSIACTITISGNLTFGKVNSAAGVKLKKAKFKLKAGKSKTVTVKMSKKQRAKVKRAKRQKRKVTAKLKLVVTSKGVKTVRKPLKLRVK